MNNELNVRPARLVLIGSVLVDVLLYVDRLPERGGDTFAQRSLLTSGGGFNILADTKRLGLPVAYVGRVGSGPMGTQIVQDLAGQDIPLLLPRVQGEDSGFDVAVVEQNAEPTFITSPGVESRLHLEDLQILQLLAGDAVYISGYDLCYPISGPTLESWLPALAEQVLLVLDPGPLVGQIPRQRLLHILSRTNIFSLNAREAEILTGESDLARAARALVPLLAPAAWVVVRVGAQGCWIASAGHEPVHIAPRRTEAIDTTGAGDAHVAALLSQLATGASFAEAAYAANIAASLSVERPGPATGPTVQELAALLREKA